MSLKTTITLGLIILLFFPKYTVADFLGPASIIVGQWGSGNTDFGLKTGEPVDLIPRLLLVDESGNIVIGDSVNFRVKIYGATGVLQNNFSYKNISPIGMWPTKLRIKSGVGIFSLYEKLQKYDYAGNLLWATSVPGSMDFWVANDGGILLHEDRNKYAKYSSAGQLLNTYTSRPLELGVEKLFRKQGDGNYLAVIEYDDATYSVIAPTRLGYFIRDISKNLYAVIRTGSAAHMHSRVYKYNKCGKVLGYVDLPENNIIEAPDTIPPRPTPLLTVMAEYGQPVIAPNGDVYTWKRTPDTYSILKWTWVDDPNVPTGPDAPTNLTIMPSTTGLYLTWAASPQDPGCITGYEVSRATSAGGVGTTIATLVAGQLKYSDTTAEAGTTYYYKVRAKAGSEYSAYTSVVSGKR